MGVLPLMRNHLIDLPCLRDRERDGVKTNSKANTSQRTFCSAKLGNIGGIVGRVLKLMYFSNLSN